tara:strand:+ start:4311 stop:4994 length:684 start_codon:yes stop_codon:yes gene_type:complete
MVNEHDSLKEKHSAIISAFDDNLSYNDFKTKLCEAYGVEKSYDYIGGDPHDQLERTAQNELDFARDCLEGKGPTQTEFGAKFGDLREVLLIEIGSRSPIQTDHTWLCGDWIFLAERIVKSIIESDYCGRSENCDIHSHTSVEVVRLWPAKKGDWETEDASGADENRIVKIPLDSSAFRDKPVRAKSIDNNYRKVGYNWVVLPKGPGKLLYPNGIPANMWTGFYKTNA